VRNSSSTSSTSTTERDYDNATWLKKLVRLTIPALPLPKAKKKKVKKAGSKQ
jgi:hypothetical protein